VFVKTNRVFNNETPSSIKKIVNGWSISNFKKKLGIDKKIMPLINLRIGGLIQIKLDIVVEAVSWI